METMKPQISIEYNIHIKTCTNPQSKILAVAHTIGLTLTPNTIYPINFACCNLKLLNIYFQLCHNVNRYQRNFGEFVSKQLDGE